MKSTQLMLTLDRRQTNRTMFRIFRIGRGSEFIGETKALFWKPQCLRFTRENLSRHMDDVVLFSPIEVATLIAPYEWARVLLINTWSSTP